MAGINVIAADTSSEAQEQHLAAKRNRVRSRLGRGQTVTDEEADMLLVSPGGQHVQQMFRFAAVGTPAEVSEYIDAFARFADADELIVAHHRGQAALRGATRGHCDAGRVGQPALRCGMTAIGKVTALITRLGANGPELCVFDHPKAGVQLPAGAMLPDEDVYAGALREAFEETGLDDLQLRSELAVLPVGGVRHVVHFVTESAAPDEWYVTTPDGGGLCWRCHWLDIAGSATLNADQQPWLEAAPARTAPGEAPAGAEKIARRPRCPDRSHHRTVLGAAVVGHTGAGQLARSCARATGRFDSAGVSPGSALRRPSAASFSRRPACACKPANLWASSAYVTSTVSALDA